MMSKELTCRQAKVLVYIKGYINQYGYPPTARNIAEDFGITSKGAFDYLKAIEKKGFIKITPKVSRGIAIV